MDRQAALRRLGPPPGFDDLTELLHMIDAATAQACRLAYDGEDSDPLLATLRELGSATGAELAAAIGHVRRRSCAA